MNTIDTISPSNQFTDTQKNTLNCFIQILSEPNHLPDFEASVVNEEVSKSKLKDIAMMLVTVGSFLGDVGILEWVYNKKHAVPNENIYPGHIDFLNKLGFSIKYPSTVD
jgi:hypothetical protein